MPSSPNYVRDPAEFNGYLIHPDGRVWRPEMVRVRRDGIARTHRAGWVSTRTRRAPKGEGGGYVYVDLWVDGRRQTWLLHRLVATCHVPNPDRLPQVNHRDGVRSHNCASNLVWVTASDNQKHAYREGIRKYNGCTAETAARIWEERNVKKRKLLDIAAEFGLSFQSISRIAKGGHHAVVTQLP